MDGTGMVPVEQIAMAERPEMQVEGVVETTATAVAAREKAAVEARFLVAIRRPRNSDEARLRILAACQRPRFAESVQYAKPIGGKRVVGLSIRFAEEAARAWGNLDIQAIVVYDDQKRRIYRVTGTDLETNSTQHQDVLVEKVVERRAVRQGDEIVGRRTNTQGETVYLKAATEDEILTKSNAALSKARRNVILSLIPSDIREEAEETAIKTLQKRDATDPTAARKQILDSFFQVGVMPDQVQAMLGKPLEQVTPADLQLLRTVFTALRDGEATWDEVTNDESLAKLRAKQPEPPSKKGKGTEGLKAAVRTPEQLDEERIAREGAPK